MNALGSLFRRQPAPLLGLDLSSSSVKLIELGRHASGKLVLERCAIEPLERGWIADGQLEKFTEVADAVRRVVRQSGTRTQRVALALAPDAVITKKIVLAGGMSEEELEIQVESEAHQYIPYAMDEVSLDFCVIGPSLDSADQVNVLIAATRKEKVQERQSLAEAAGLQAVILDVAPYASRLATARWIEQFPSQGQDAVVALFEVGSFTTRMQVLCHQELLYERDQAFGGAQLTELIVRQYGFSDAEAEAKKRSADLPDDYGAGVLDPFVTRMAQEIAWALQYFFTSTQRNRVDYLLLAGGSAALTGLADAVTRQTSFACLLVNPFDGMAIGSRIRGTQLQLEAPSYLTACGLALRRFL